MIVPKESATIGLNEERISPLNGNHLEIVKFYSKEDVNFIRVAGNISKLNNIVNLAVQRTGERETTLIQKMS